VKAASCLALFVLALVGASCSQGETSEGAWPLGWSRDPNPGWPGVIYRFGDASDTTLYGRCHGRAVFTLSRGGYSDESKIYELITDGHKRTLETYLDRHHGGRFLPVEEPADVERLATARKITFRVGDWERSLDGSPLFADFVELCKSWPAPRSEADTNSQPGNRSGN